MRCKNCNIKFKPIFFNQKTCSNICLESFLITSSELKHKNRMDIPKKIKIVLNRIKLVSPKRKKQLQLYKIIKEKYLKDNPKCEICKCEATEIHHKNGRNGERLNDTNYFMSICRYDHSYIHENPKQSREKGWLI